MVSRWEFPWAKVAGTTVAAGKAATRTGTALSLDNSRTRTDCGMGHLRAESRPAAFKVLWISRRSSDCGHLSCIKTKCRSRIESPVLNLKQFYCGSRGGGKWVSLGKRTLTRRWRKPKAARNRCWLTSPRLLPEEGAFGWKPNRTPTINWPSLSPTTSSRYSFTLRKIRAGSTASACYGLPAC